MSHQCFQSMSLLEKGGGNLALYYHIGNHWPSGVAVILSTQALPQSPPLHVASILPKLIIIAKPHHTCTDVSAIVHVKENKPYLCEKDEGYTVREHV